MKTNRKILNFCNEFTFCDQYNIDRMIELKNFGKYINNLLSRSENQHDDSHFKVMGIVDNTSLKVIVEDVKNIQHERKSLRVVILQMSCLEKL